VTGTAALLDAVLGYWRALPADRRARFRHLHVSTDEVYGALGPEGVFREESPLLPRSPYAASKAAADQLSLAYAATYGLPVLVSRCSNNYGPCQFPEKLIPLMILAALEEQPLPVYGDGLQVRDWLHVEDHVAGLEAIVMHGRPGEVYNLGGEAERTNLAVVELLCTLLDAREPSPNGPRQRLIRHVEDRPGHDRRYAVCTQKARRELEWRPAIAFEQGLSRTVDWYLARRDWWEPLRSRYRGQRLGLAHAG
jgi:dTDP-glucose 4,6-dehydratase